LCNLRIHLSLSIAAKPAQEEAFTRGQQLHVVKGEALPAHVLHEQAVESFKSEGFELQHCRNIIGGNEGVFEAENHETPILRAWLHLTK